MHCRMQRLQKRIDGLVSHIVMVVMYCHAPS